MTEYCHFLIQQDTFFNEYIPYLFGGGGGLLATQSTHTPPLPLYQPLRSVQ